ncbi:MAG: hypothetical protein IJ756_01035 [Paludibacteraceae bacterium]|nr:hypothetical protein [Paludibacteraceae bacterium]
MPTQLRQYKAFKPFFYFRDWIMDATGLFRLKHFVKLKLFYWKLQRQDWYKKLKIRRYIRSIDNNLIQQDITTNDIIFSVTSYGKRVTDTLPYMLYSLLIQTQKPKKVVVFLDNDNWSDEKLPSILTKLQQIGIQFYYCEDLKSFKKLIPALKMFPNNPIVTLDDDFYYNKQYVERISKAYDLSDKKTVLGHIGVRPIKKDGTYTPYNKWGKSNDNDTNSDISFIGCGGVCYPPHIFDNEILKSDIFMNLCPAADDIWFWAMEERQHIRRAYIQPMGYGHNTYVNRVEEYDLSITSTLMFQNVNENKNNQQLEAVVNYYNL